MAENIEQQEFMDENGLRHMWERMQTKFAKPDLSNLAVHGPKVYVPDQTIEMRSTKVAIPGMDRIGLVEGETYTVKFNGTTYTCVAKWAYGALVLGNPGLMEYKSDTDEPFIIEDVPASMQQYVGGPANIAYRAQKYEYTVTARTDGGGTLTADGLAEHVAVGSKAYINGDWYEVTEIVDNDTISFKYYTFAAVGDTVTVYHETISVSVESVGETVQKIDPKYIPAPDWNQNDKYGPCYIENRTHWQEESYLPFCDYKIGTNGYFSCYFYLHVGETYKVNWFGTIYECVAEESGSSITLATDLFNITVSMWGIMKITPADATLEYITVGITGPGKVHELDEKYLPTVPVDKGGTGVGSIPENSFLVGGAEGRNYMNRKTPAEVLDLIGAAPAGFGLGQDISYVPPNSNLDEAMKTGWYQITDTVINRPDDYNYGVVETYCRTPDSIGQVFRGINRHKTIKEANSYNLVAMRGYSSTLGWGPWEWVNPPMEFDIEYRTTQRYEGKPVYVKMVNIPSMPAAAGLENRVQASLSVSDVSTIIHIEVECYSTSNHHAKIPYFGNDMTVLLGGYAVKTGGNIMYYIQASKDMSHYTGVLTAWYTKTTD